jgi:hypothetical protein
MNFLAEPGACENPVGDDRRYEQIGRSDPERHPVLPHHRRRQTRRPLNEFIGGEIVVRGPRDGDGCQIWGLIQRQILLRTTAGLMVSGRSGLMTLHGYFIPDMTATSSPI